MFCFTYNFNITPNIYPNNNVIFLIRFFFSRFNPDNISRVSLQQINNLSDVSAVAETGYKTILMFSFLDVYFPCSLDNGENYMEFLR